MDRTTKYFIIAASCVVIFHRAILLTYLLFSAAWKNSRQVNPLSNAQQCLAQAGPMPLPEAGMEKFNEWERGIQDCYSR